MKRFFHSFFVYSTRILFRYLLPCCIASALIVMLILLIKNKDRKNNYFKSLVSKGAISSFVLIAYSLVPIWSAVILRFKEPRQNPFVDIYGGWWFDNWKYIYDFSLLYNIFMFAPICAMLYAFVKLALNKTPNKIKIAIVSVFFSMLYSGLIEVLQIAFKVGTFQISDLVYNTLGALIGAIITNIIINKIKKTV